MLRAAGKLDMLVYGRRGREQTASACSANSKLSCFSVYVTAFMRRRGDGDGMRVVWPVLATVAANACNIRLKAAGNVGGRGRYTITRFLLCRRQEMSFND